MILTLPALVLLAAVLYFVARHEGWLDSMARWSENRTGRGGPGTGRRSPGQLGKRPGDADGERLEVFEEFLSSLGRDDSEEQG